MPYCLCRALYGQYVDVGTSRRRTQKHYLQVLGVPRYKQQAVLTAGMGLDVVWSASAWAMM